MLAAALVAVGTAAAAMSGCVARPGDDDARQVEEWIEQQEWVLSATSSTSDDPWSASASFITQLDPAIPDDDLERLATEAERRADGKGWPAVYLTWELGDDRSFSNLGGAATLDVFLALRDEASFETFTARGANECSAYCATIDAESPAGLLAAVERMRATAEEVGGVQRNLGFTATDPGSTFWVTAELDAPVDEAVAVWESLVAAGTVSIKSARAWVVEPVGDLPPDQLLDVTVADEASRIAAEQLAAGQSAVEVRVSVAEG
ncbi:hypothetical protein GCM10009851_18410 [Herbiconiux moechotypicola]|uniref:Lipoprotein n=1 Tax=Herbiconiux moechotypicola TaxID=637393 RepID=A0ABP5QIH7_9MICO